MRKPMTKEECDQLVATIKKLADRVGMTFIADPEKLKNLQK